MTPRRAPNLLSHEMARGCFGKGVWCAREGVNVGVREWVHQRLGMLVD